MPPHGHTTRIYTTSPYTKDHFLSPPLMRTLRQHTHTIRDDSSHKNPSLHFITKASLFCTMGMATLDLQITPSPSLLEIFKLGWHGRLLSSTYSNNPNSQQMRIVVRSHKQGVSTPHTQGTPAFYSSFSASMICTMGCIECSSSFRLSLFWEAYCEVCRWDKIV
jgi:hypothetical protein